MQFIKRYTLTVLTDSTILKMCRLKSYEDISQKPVVSIWYNYGDTFFVFQIFYSFKYL